MNKRTPVVSVITRLKPFLDTVPHTIFIHDIHGKITEVNTAACENTGYTRQELLSMHVKDIEAAYLPQEIPAVWKALKSQGVFTGTGRHRRKDGTSYPVELKLSLLPDSLSEHIVAYVRNLSEETYHEDTFPRTLDQYRFMIEQQDDLICRWTPAGTILYINQKFAWYLHDTPVNLVKRNMYEFLPAAEARHIRRQLGSLTRENSTFTYEQMAVLPEGKTVFFLWQTKAVFNAAGDVADLLSVGRDVSDRHRMEHALHRSEDDYRSLVQNINIGVYRNTPGPHGRFLQANPFIVRMFGYESEEDFFKIKVSDLYQNARDREAFVAKISREGLVRNEELALKKKDGSTIVASITARARYDEQGTVRYFDGVIEDITERKMFQQRLEMAAQELQLTFDSVPDMIFMIARDYTIIRINKAVGVFLKKDVDGILGRKCYEVFHGLSQPFHLCPYKKCLAEKTVVCEEYFEPSLQKYLQVTLGPIFQDRQRCMGCVHTARDITDRKNSEIEREQSRRLLEDQAKALERKTTALAEVIAYIEQEKRGVQDQIIAQIDKVIIPSLKRLQRRSSFADKKYVKIVEQNVQNLMASFSARIQKEMYTLSPRELEICSMIKNGMKNKEIAETLNVSLRTIETHRFVIRRKLKLHKTKMNLVTYLTNISSA